jgi:hypothetical protein
MMKHHVEIYRNDTLDLETRRNVSPCATNKWRHFSPTKLWNIIISSNLKDYNTKI